VRRATAALGAASSLFVLGQGTASAHVIPQPAYLTDGHATRIQFVAPNERLPHLFTELTVTMPAGVTLHSVAPPPGWRLAVNGRTATWSGGRIGRGSGVLFGIDASTELAPGAISFDAVQRYDDGGRVRWKVGLTVLPAPSPAPKQHIVPAIVTGILGLIVIGLLLYRMRERPRSRRALRE